MARPKLTTEAVERSTYTIPLTFADAAGAAVTPTSLVWTLTDGAGTVVNSRADVVAVPAETMTIVLTGADLALLAGESGARDVRRIVTVEAVYTSTEGAGLTLNEEYEFGLRALVVVA